MRRCRIRCHEPSCKSANGTALRQPGRRDRDRRWSVQLRAGAGAGAAVWLAAGQRTTAAGVSAGQWWARSPGAVTRPARSHTGAPNTAQQPPPGLTASWSGETGAAASQLSHGFRRFMPRYRRTLPHVSHTTRIELKNDDLSGSIQIKWLPKTIPHLEAPAVRSDPIFPVGSEAAPRLWAGAGAGVTAVSGGDRGSWPETVGRCGSRCDRRVRRCQDAAVAGPDRLLYRAETAGENESSCRAVEPPQRDGGTRRSKAARAVISLTPLPPRPESDSSAPRRDSSVTPHASRPGHVTSRHA